MNPLLLFALLPLLPLAAVPAAADFKTDTRSVKLDYLQNEVTVIFETDGVGIEKVTPLCDCITARIDGSRLIARVDSSKFSRDNAQPRLDFRERHDSIYFYFPAAKQLQVGPVQY